MGEFQDSDDAAGLEYALNFAQAGFVVGKVAKTEGAGYQIERRAGEWELERIGFKKRHWRYHGLVRLRGHNGAFLLGANQHGMCEIGTDDAGFSGTRESESEITGSAAEIENKNAGAVEDGLQTSSGAGAPEAIELQRKEMVE